jgi:hypothetical protein
MQRALLPSHGHTCWRRPGAQRSPQVPVGSSRNLTLRVAPVSRHAEGVLTTYIKRGGRGTPAAAQAPSGMTVLAEAVVQLQGGAATARLDQQMLALFPDHIASATGTPTRLLCMLLQAPSAAASMHSASAAPLHAACLVLLHQQDPTPEWVMAAHSQCITWRR